MKLLRGVKSTLHELKQRKRKIAIGSSSKNAVKIIEKAGLPLYIDAIVSGLDTPLSKPNPDIFLIAVSRIGIECKNCLVVEDSAAGIEAAKRAGMKTIGVGAYYRELEADYRVNSLEQIKNWQYILDN